MDESAFEQFQDLGEATQTIRTMDGVGPSGVEVLYPDDAASHVEAMQELRAVLDEYYDERLSELADDDQRVIVERLVVQSDDLPYIEYSLVDEVDDEE